MKFALQKHDNNLSFIDTKSAKSRKKIIFNSLENLSRTFSSILLSKDLKRSVKIVVIIGR
ncbi:hypothetical protein GCM10007042_05020 [Butyricimonas paravirosa]|nr:hypothetical protein GCM10007042_05020 [Butyricimonas paravirosa]